ncbi:MAG: imidazolonepropionase, partial [Steroidobacteraceae bacterium]
MAETLRWWRNPRIAACDAAMSRFASGAVITPGARIEWVGAERDLPGEYRPEESHDLRGAWVTPGLIDCHTHLVFAGNR